MIDLLWLIICIIIGAPMIISPQKILERPACKIKSAGAVRMCGVILIAVGILFLFI